MEEAGSIAGLSDDASAGDNNVMKRGYGYDFKFEKAPGDDDVAAVAAHVFGFTADVAPGCERRVSAV